uniref:Ovule protein n=1 Tax=Macrostomum lignano TaxID=282301 RepID=A0A1I8HLJ2_9PLAT
MTVVRKNATRYYRRWATAHLVVTRLVLKSTMINKLSIYRLKNLSYFVKCCTIDARYFCVASFCIVKLLQTN